MMGVHDYKGHFDDAFDSATVDTLINKQVTPYVPPPPPAPPESGYLEGTGKALMRGIAGIPVYAGHTLEWNEDYQRSGDESQLNIVNRAGKGIADAGEALRDSIAAPIYGDNEVKRSVFQGVESVPVSLAQVAPATTLAIAGSALGPGGTVGGAALGQALSSAVMYRAQAQDTAEQLAKQAPNLDRNAMVDTAKKAGHAEWQGEAVSDIPEALIYSRIPGLKVGVNTVRSLLKPGMKQFLKNYAMTLPAEQLGEGFTAYRQAQALNEVVPEEQQQTPWAAVREQAGPTSVMTLLMGAGGTGLQRLRSNNIAKTLENPVADPDKRYQAAAQVAELLKESQAGEAAARNFLDHAAIAIGDATETGTPPAAISLDDTAILQPMQPPSSPAAPQPSVSPAAPQPSVSPDSRQPSVSPDSRQPSAGTSLLDTASAPASEPTPTLQRGLEKAGIAVPTVGGTSLLSDSNPVAQPVAIHDATPATPVATPLAMQDQPLQPVAAPIATPAPAIRPADELLLDEARDWAQRSSGQRPELMKLNGESRASYDARILDTYKKSQQPAVAEPAAEPAAKVITPARERKQPQVNPDRDSLLQAIAKMGGIDIHQARTLWGKNISDQTRDLNRRGMGFGTPVLRAQNGRALDDVAQSLADLGYLTTDEHGKADLNDLYEKLSRTARGEDLYSISNDSAVESKLNRQQEQLDTSFNPQELDNSAPDPLRQKAERFAARFNHDLDGLSREDLQRYVTEVEQWSRANSRASAPVQKGIAGMVAERRGLTTPRQPVPKPVRRSSSSLATIGEIVAASRKNRTRTMPGNTGIMPIAEVRDEKAAQSQGSDSAAVRVSETVPTGILPGMDARQGDTVPVLRQTDDIEGGDVNGQEGRRQEVLKGGEPKAAPAARTNKLRDARIRFLKGQRSLSDKQRKELARLKALALETKAHEAATSHRNDTPQPTQAQIEAGNYKKGHVTLHGLDIAIENPAGSMRRGVDENGKEWATKLAHHYGYIKGTVGKDKDHVDVFIGPDPESNRVYVVDQIDPKTGKLDEHKVMMGFTSLAAARKGYLANYDKSGERRIGDITEVSVDEFKRWLKEGNQKKAFAEFEQQTSVPLENATAPEHVTTGVTDKELAKIVHEFNIMQDGMIEDDEKIHHLFDPPARNDIVRLQDKVKVYHAKHGWMTTTEAKAKIAEWKKHAREQGRTGANSEKVVLSLFDLSGEWSRPWEEAGYQVFRFDIQSDPEVGDVHRFSVEHFNDWFGSFDGMDIYAILAATPCTDFAVSGARHFAAKDADGRTISSVKLVHQTLATIEYFKPAVWAIENPVGRIEKLGGLPPWRLSFDPNHLGDTYTKKTLLWGRFNADLPVAPVEPTEGSKMHRQYGGKSMATKNARSVTPEGFAYAFFMANNLIDHTAMGVANKYDRLDRKLIEKAVASGLSDTDIDSLVEDFYYQELDDKGAEQALRDAISERGGDVNDVSEVRQEAGNPEEVPPVRRETVTDAATESDVLSWFEDNTDEIADLVGRREPKEVIPDANTIFTEDAAAKARELLRSKLNRVNTGLDPEMLQAGITLAGYHIEKGARTFAAYAKAMLEDLGEAVRPYLKSWYMGVKYDPRAAGFEGLDSAVVVEKIDVNQVEIASSGDIIKEKDKGVTDDVERDGGDMERNSGDATAEDAMVKTDVRAGSDPTEHGLGDGSGATRETRDTIDRGDILPRSETAPAGKLGDQSIHSKQERSQLADSITGGLLSERSGDTGKHGTAFEPVAAAAVGKSAARVATLTEKQTAQTAAQSVKVIQGDANNIDKTLPFLLPGQRDDVRFAEERHAKPDGYGVLFTNGTGTGKTYTGLGIIKRLELQGKSNILIVTPNTKIINDWVKSGKNLLLDITPLKDTKDSGKGITITTYANLGVNDALALRQWDAVVFDEAHNLNSNKSGDATGAQNAMQAITLHPDGAWNRARMLNPELVRQIDQAREAHNTAVKAKVPVEELNLLRKKLDDLYARFDEARQQVREEIAASQGEKRPRVVFLSATPFAYDKNIQYAAGYLFDYGPKVESGGYNSGNSYQRFMMTHFGYTMRYDKLTEPGPEVDRGVMQRQFNQWLKAQGVLSGRMLDSDYDYDRRFVLIDSAVGRQIDEGLTFLRDTPRLRPVEEIVSKRFDYLSRRYLLEAIKAREAIPYIRENIALGRKVVVFHDYNQGGGFSPFDLSEQRNSETEVVYHDGKEQKTEKLGTLVAEFMSARPDLVSLPVGSYNSPIVEMQRAFHEVLLFNGTVSAKERIANVDLFQTDGNGQNLILVQSDAGGAGISLHDTTGAHSRVLINLGLPTKPTMAIQQEGRIYRVGQASNAMFRYFNTATNWERHAFATSIARKTSGAENLASGDEARMLLDAFVQGFEESDSYPPGFEGEGTGGKERDRAANAALTAYDQALTHYWAQQKKNSRTKSAEGKDYFATPEPLGYKMAEWADIGNGESVLEPSGGHGAIGRYFNPLAKRRMIEPSLELSSRAALVFDGDIVQGRFEDHNTINKYDAIVMNPPFGSGGKTAVDHLEKATQHLKDGGRIVALLPDGPSANKKLEKFLYEGREVPVEPLYIDAKLGPIYQGDTIHLGGIGTIIPASTKTVWHIDDYGASRFVREKGEKKEHAVNLVAAEKVDPTGPRKKAIASDLHMVADITLPSATFERAGTSVATHIVILDKGRVDTSHQITRDYSNAKDTKELFDRIRDAEIPQRERPVTVTNSAASAVVDDTGKTTPVTESGFTLAQFNHTQTRAPQYVATLAKQLDKDDYAKVLAAAKKHGGYYSKYNRAPAVAGFLFKSEEARTTFMQELSGETVPSENGITLYSNPMFNPALIVSELGGLADNIKAARPHLLNLGKYLYIKGARTYQAFAQAVKKQLGPLWNELKSQTLWLWQQVRQEVKNLSDDAMEEMGNDIVKLYRKGQEAYRSSPLNNERGAVGRDINAGRETRFALGDKETTAQFTPGQFDTVFNRITAKLTPAQRSAMFAVVDSFNDLPATVRSESTKQGKNPDEISGVFHRGKIYVVRENIKNPAWLEEVLFHEWHGHVGLTGLFGKDLTAKMLELYHAVGVKELDKIARKYGINLQRYNQGLAKAGYDLDTRRAIVMEELLAFMTYEQSSGGIKAKLREVIGAVREWLRAHGFLTLAEYGDTDLAFLLKRARLYAESGAGVQSAGTVFAQEGDFLKKLEEKGITVDVLDKLLSRTPGMQFSARSPEEAPKFALSPAISDRMVEAAGKIDIAAIGKLINPLDWSRSAQWFDDVTPNNIKRAIAYLFRIPVFEAEQDSRKLSFVKTGEEREISRMELKLSMWGGVDLDMVQRLSWPQRMKALVDWSNGSEQSTEWGRIRQTYRDLTREQRDMFNRLVVESDRRNHLYATLDGVHKNKLLEQVDAPTFALYQRRHEHINNTVHSVIIREIEKMMKESGIPHEERQRRIADYRNEHNQRKAWVSRNHGEGEWVVNGYRTVETLDWKVRDVEGGKQAYMKFHPGGQVMGRILALAEEYKVKITQDDFNGVIANGGDIEAFVAATSEIIPAIVEQGGKLPRVKVYVRYHQSKLAAKNSARKAGEQSDQYSPHYAGQKIAYEVEHSKALTESMYQDMNGDMAVEAALLESADKAFKRGELSKEDYDKLVDQLVHNTAEVLMGRAAGKYQIRRAPYVIEGYDKENVLELDDQYISGVAGMLSKAQYAHEQFKLYRKANNEVKPWAERYIKDSLTVQGVASRWSGNLRSIAALWYMGFRPASAVINATQIWTLGQAELSMHSKSPVVELLRAQKDVLADKLTEEEKSIFATAIYKVHAIQTVMAEMTGHEEGATGKASRALHFATDKAMALFQQVEVNNRKTMLLAAYRVFRQQGMSHDSAFAAAAEVDNKVNFAMGRYNLPGWARNPVGRTAYALQSFVWNQFNWIYNRATSGEKKQMVALMRYTAALMLIGGLAALPGGDELDKLLRRMLGKSYKLELQQWMGEHAAEYGTFGEAVNGFAWHGAPSGLGVNISNALKMQIPVVSQVLDGKGIASLLGVFGGFGDKLINTMDYTSKGMTVRAAESLAPEAFAGTMRAIRQMNDGVTTSHGKRVFDENGKPLKYSATDAVKRSLGFQPLEQSRRTEVVMQGQELQKFWNEERQNRLDNLRAADTPEKKRDSLREIMKFNRDLRGSQAFGLVNIITAESVKRATEQKADKKKAGWLKRNM